MKFKIGDLAYHIVFKPHSFEVMQEEIVTITNVYSDYDSRFDPYPELYEITRPNGEVRRGFLPHGLQKV